jgi:tRNA(Ile2) C34 agmatinyltransferase TiaS
MDTTRCPHCNKRMKVVATPDGRTGFQCLSCDEVDPFKADAVKRAASPLATPIKAA